VAAALITLGFVLSHGIPVESERTEPYWGDGSADVVQWLGFSLILACSAITAVLAWRLPRRRALLAASARSVT
jgi:hypothetical protein